MEVHSDERTGNRAARFGRNGLVLRSVSPISQNLGITEQVRWYPMNGAPT